MKKAKNNNMENNIGKFYKLKKWAKWQYLTGDLTDTLSKKEKREGMLIKYDLIKAYLQRKDNSIIKINKLSLEEGKD